jgi:hypothetical protein
MRVAVTGATRFIGARLVPFLREEGHQVVALVRDSEKAKHLEGAEVRAYDSMDAKSVGEALQGADAVVNLAGENLFAKRWSKAVLARIRDSRVITTGVLVKALEGLSPRPKVLVSGSAVGLYGPRDPDEVFDEYTLSASEFAPRDFLAHVCLEWEMAARKAVPLGIRTVLLRTGVVLDHGGGALVPMEKPFKMFVGGPIGSGKQVVSWIHREDHVRMVRFALEKASIEGPLCAVAPNPVSNREFSKALGRALGRPSWLPAPGFALRVVLGKVATVIVTGQRVVPTKAVRSGFVFRYPRLEEALAAVYGRAPFPASPARV